MSPFAVLCCLYAVSYGDTRTYRFAVCFRFVMALRVLRITMGAGQLATGRPFQNDLMKGNQYKFGVSLPVTKTEENNNDSLLHRSNRLPTTNRNESGARSICVHVNRKRLSNLDSNRNNNLFAKQGSLELDSSAPFYSKSNKRIKWLSINSFCQVSGLWFPLFWFSAGMHKAWLPSGWPD